MDNTGHAHCPSSDAIEDDVLLNGERSIARWEIGSGPPDVGIITEGPQRPQQGSVVGNLLLLAPHLDAVEENLAKVLLRSLGKNNWTPMGRHRDPASGLHAPSVVLPGVFFRRVPG